MLAPPEITKDGYEVHFATNHIGHALMIRLLLATLQNTPGGRIVSLTSVAFLYPPPGGIQFDTLKTPRSVGIIGGVGAAGWNYCQSKLANILYVQELSRRYPDVTSVAIHPGTVATPLNTRLGWADWLLIRITNPRGFSKPEQGAYNQLWAATTPTGNLTNGNYYEPVGKKGQESKYTNDKELSKRLFEWTETEVQPYLN